MDDNHWSHRAACHQHPLLGPDAWTEVADGRPIGDGIKALMVCRYTCPVRKECGKGVTSAQDTVAGGGWWNLRGQFLNPGDGQYLDANQAATYLGVSVPRWNRHALIHKVPVVHREGGRKYFHIDSVRRMVRILGASHGTREAYQLHQLRGEDPCALCAWPFVDNNWK